MNIFGIEKAFKIKRDRKWNSLYWAIDFHDTLFKGQYNKNQLIELYPHASRVLYRLSYSGNILIAYTSTPIDKVHEICSFLYDEYRIHFTYVNENPEYSVVGDYADFSKKFYYNILLDDKAGFDPETDWKLIEKELIRIGEW